MSRQNHSSDEYEPAQPHPQESLRIKSLLTTELLDSERSEQFDLITSLVAQVFDMPTCLISLVDRNRQWFLSKCGLEYDELSRDDAFCAHAIHEEDMLLVNDASNHPVFKHNKLVTEEPHIRFYVGAVIRDEHDLPLGTLCLIDYKPRDFSAGDTIKLQGFKQLIIQEMFQSPKGASTRNRRWLNLNRDPLTNAFVSRAFYDEVLRQQAFNGVLTPFYMISIKLNSIDSVRETYGSIVGDEFLLELMVRLRSCIEQLGDNSVIGQIDGCNYAVYFEHDQSKSDIQVINRLVHCLSGGVTTSVGDLLPSISFGINNTNLDEGSPSNAYKIARNVCNTLLIKNGVTGGAVSQDEKAAFEVRSRLLVELKENIENNGLHLVYQPKVRSDTFEINGFETLVRWIHKEQGPIPPNEILDLAKDSNQLFELESWIFRTAIKQVAEWKKLGFSIPPVSLNVTDDTLISIGFVDHVLAMLNEYGVNGSEIGIEIVESSMIKDFNQTIRAMHKLNQHGVAFSLDDFGTGYSSLSYLKLLPIKTLKIDKSFVDHIIDDLDAATMCSSIIGLARNLGIESVAEGVETHEQSIVLRTMRCDVFQGYYYSKPVFAQQIEEYLNDGLVFSTSQVRKGTQELA